MPFVKKELHHLLMNNIRAVFKVVLLIVFTLGTYAVYFTVYLLLKLFQQPYEPWRNFYMRNWSRGMALILNIHIKRIGTPPAPPFVLVSNHVSYIDILPMFINMKCTFVAKKEVESWPVLGYMVKKTGVIFINRAIKRDVTRVNKLMSKELNEYQGIVLFPEGTTTAGDKVLPFRSSLLDFPADNSIPVYYSAIQYTTGKTDPPAEMSVCFFGGRDPFHKHVMKLASNKRIDCTVTYAEHPVKTDDRKELARLLHKSVAELADTIR